MLGCLDKFWTNMLRQMSSCPALPRELCPDSLVSESPWRGHLACLADPSINLCLTYFQQLTNCLKFDTFSSPLCFQQLPTVKFCNSFLLMTLQQYPGVCTPLPVRNLKFYFNSAPPLCGLCDLCVKKACSAARRNNSEPWRVVTGEERNP